MRCYHFAMRRYHRYQNIYDKRFIVNIRHNTFLNFSVKTIGQRIVKSFFVEQRIQLTCNRYFNEKASRVHFEQVHSTVNIWAVIMYCGISTEKMLITSCAVMMIDQRWFNVVEITLEDITWPWTMIWIWAMNGYRANILKCCRGQIMP